ncbi:hypothetical protein Bbelb_447410, partial [Branchiostoma belcheri]
LGSSSELSNKWSPQSPQRQKVRGAIRRASRLRHGPGEMCREGGTVALPLDTNEQAYLVFFKNCLNQNAQFWLGLSRPVGTWVDSQGSALGGFSAWAPGEPDERTKLCSRLVFGAQSNSERRNKWADAPCGESFRYICKTIIQEDGSLQIRIYRKPTHTDQYLNFDSNHPLDHKLGVIRTLSHRANAIVSDPQDLETEKSHLTQALKLVATPSGPSTKRPAQPPNTKPSAGTKSKGLVVLPYIKDLSEALRRIFISHGIATCFKPTTTLRHILVAPKDKTPKEKKCGVIYHIPCQGKNNRGPARKLILVKRRGL